MGKISQHNSAKDSAIRNISNGVKRRLVVPAWESFGKGWVLWLELGLAVPGGRVRFGLRSAFNEISQIALMTSVTYKRLSKFRNFHYMRFRTRGMSECIGIEGVGGGPWGCFSTQY